MQYYRPQMYLRTADVTTSLTWPESIADAADKMVCRSAFDDDPFR